ncbi:MAG: hypothetical protein K2Y27_18845 [Xanthobacteraceae bacterium]|nr:hypothetical protein [Xanthobacteraceae bacterium]
MASRACSNMSSTLRINGPPFENRKQVDALLAQQPSFMNGIVVVGSADVGRLLWLDLRMRCMLACACATRPAVSSDVAMRSDRARDGRFARNNFRSRGFPALFLLPARVRRWGWGGHVYSGYSGVR